MSSIEDHYVWRGRRYPMVTDPIYHGASTWCDACEARRPVTVVAMSSTGNTSLCPRHMVAFLDERGLTVEDVT